MKKCLCLLLPVLIFTTAPYLMAQNNLDKADPVFKEGETFYIGLGYLSPVAKNFSTRQKWGGNMELGLSTKLPFLPLQFFPALKLSSFSREIHPALFDNLLLYQGGIKTGYPVLKEVFSGKINIVPFLGAGYSGGRYYYIYSHHYFSGQYELLKINGITGTAGAGIQYKRFLFSLGYEYFRLQGRASEIDARSYFLPSRRIRWVGRRLASDVLILDHLSISLAYFF